MVLSGLLSEPEHEEARLLLTVVDKGAGLLDAPADESVAGDVKPTGSCGRMFWHWTGLGPRFLGVKYWQGIFAVWQLLQGDMPSHWR
jgi:hypothetical protein